MIHNTHILGFLANGLLLASLTGFVSSSADAACFKKIQEIVLGDASKKISGQRLCGPTPPYGDDD